MKTMCKLSSTVRMLFAARQYIILAFAAARCFEVAGAAQLRKASVEFPQQTSFAYDYARHGQDWTFGTCGSRSRQSPISLPVSAALADPFHYQYGPIVEPFELMNNGKVYLVDLSDKGYGGITYENVYYELQSIEVHSLSEHWWANRQRPLELQLVHKRADGDASLVVSVGIDQPLIANPYAPYLLQFNATSSGNLRAGSKHGQLPTTPVASNAFFREPPPFEPNFNPALQAFLTQQLPPVGMKLRVPANSAHSYDLNTFLAAGTFFDYGGSFTEPPCAETVTWLVRNEPILASVSQMMYLQQAIGLNTHGNGNYRSVMPLNGRTVSLRSALLGEPALMVPPDVPLAPMKPVSDRLEQTRKMAMDASRYAKASINLMKDLDRRMHDAAQAHANALAPQLEPLVVHGHVVDLNATGMDVAKKSESFANRTAVRYVQKRLSPDEMQETAVKMARILSDATRQVVEEATEEIARDSKKAAKEAAREAAEEILVAR